MRKEIYDAYEAIKPDEEAKKRMLKNIQALSAEDFDRRKEFMRTTKSKRILRIAAAAAVAVMVPVTAYATGLFGLHELNLGKKEFEVPVRIDEGEAGTEDPFKMEKFKVDMISLQGMADSPEAKACNEWLDFYESYDADGSIAAKIGNEPTEFREEYGAYSCYTREMADKIEELCEKYQLKKKEEPVIEDDYKKILDRYGIGDILKPSEDVVYRMQGETCDSDGNFNLGGEITFPENPQCLIIYEFTRSVKGFFDTAVLNVGNINDYEQWEYETQNGETVLLAKNGDKALIIADKEESFISVCMDGYLQKEANSVRDPYEISREELEKIAESLDFSVIP